MDLRPVVTEEAQKLYGFKKRQKGQRFENYEKKPGNREALAAMQTLAKSFLDGVLERGVMLIGGVGCGKTHLSAAVVNHILDNWRIPDSVLRDAALLPGACSYDFLRKLPRVVLTTTVDMYAKIREAYDDNGETLEDAVRRYRCANLLILDDVGMEKTTEWSLERLAEIIDSRYNELLPTVITTNLTPEKLKAAVGDRVYDRIREMCKLYTITEPSHRPTA